MDLAEMAEEGHFILHGVNGQVAAVEDMAVMEETVVNWVLVEVEDMEEVQMVEMEKMVQLAEEDILLKEVMAEVGLE